MPCLLSAQEKSAGWRGQRDGFSEGLGDLEELQGADRLCQASPAVATGGPGATAGLGTGRLAPPVLPAAPFFQTFHA
jgi:hypothetical protein